MEEQKLTDFEVFNSEEFGEVRAVIIDNIPYFAGKDVATSLGYVDSKNALKRHVDSEDKLGWRFATPAGSRELTVINESGIYSLIFKSKLPSAKKFKRWVTSEVLPTIRKHGMYITQEKLNLEKEELLKEVEEYKNRADKSKVRYDKAVGFIKDHLYSSILSDRVLSDVSAEFGIPQCQLMTILRERYIIDAEEDDEYGYERIEGRFSDTIKWAIARSLEDGDYTVDIRKPEKDKYGNKTGRTYMYRQFTDNAYDLIKEELLACGYKPILDIPEAQVLKQDSYRVLNIGPKDFVLMLARPQDLEV